MKFVCNKDNLLKTLNVVSKAIPIKSSYPELTNVYISAENGQVKLVGTDTATTIVSFVGAAVEEEGALTIPARLFANFLSNLSTDKLSVSTKESILTVAAGKVKTTFNGLSATGYPELPDLSIDEKKATLVNAKEFSETISQVSFSVALEATRMAFTGILLTFDGSELAVVGTDGARLSERVVSPQKKGAAFSALIPAKTVIETARIMHTSDKGIKLFLNSSSNMCLFETDDYVIATRLLEGDFPDYKKVIPATYATSAVFDTAAFSEAVRLASVFATQQKESSLIQVTIAPETGFKIFSDAQEYGSHTSELEAELEGPAVEVLFNSRFLMDLLSNVKFKKMLLGVNSATTACVFKPADDPTAYIYVVVPTQRVVTD